MNPGAVITDLLCDIEGTIGSISFVRDTLFGYARERLPHYIREHAEQAEVVRELASVARSKGLEPDDLEALIQVLMRWMDEDRKETPLKTLQGMLWAQAYMDGDFRSHVYPDAHRQLLAWHGRGLRLHIYSSGSVQAQKLYFRYSDFGDLRPLISGWFDTTSGPKTASSSYATITSRLDVPANQVLFLSDSPRELDAAAGAGMRTTWLMRPEDGAPDPLSVHTIHPQALSFDEVRP